MRKYYTNGVHEKRFDDFTEVPAGWVPGRLKPINGTSGKIWYNNGESELLINRDVAPPNGFKLGRVKKSESAIRKHKENMLSKEYHFYNNCEREILLSANEKIPDGFVKGRLPMSAAQKDKLRQSHLGKHHTEEAKAKISEHSNNNREKAKLTCIEKYGCEHPFNNFFVKEKVFKTKKINGTFNSSKPETNYYYKLCEKYGKKNVLRNYKSQLYPFYCDFYIKSKSLFIELNLHWTHGGKPYDPNDKECQEKLAIWQEKSKTSQFYRNAIQRWTVRDLEKQKIAKENNLNYVMYYLEEDVDNSL